MVRVANVKMSGALHSTLSARQRTPEGTATCEHLGEGGRRWATEWVMRMRGGELSDQKSFVHLFDIMHWF